MSRRPVTIRRRFRRIAALTIAMQIVTLTAGPIVDVALEAQEPQANHLESEGRDSCSVHDHLTCQVCSVITLVGTAPPPSAATAEPSELLPHGDRRAPRAPLDGSLGSHSPRAPPA